MIFVEKIKNEKREDKVSDESSSEQKVVSDIESCGLEDKDSETDKSAKSDKKDDDNTLKEIRDFVIALVIAIVAATLIRKVVFMRADVQGPSMQSTLHNNDVLFVEKICLLTKDYKREQIVIFDSENTNHDIFIKRVIGIEGDKLEIKGGKVYRNGVELKEDYLNKGMKTYGDTFLHEGQVYTVPRGCIFVMGDNRTNSADSRKIGPVNINNIKGHVIIRTYPFNQMKIF